MARAQFHPFPLHHPAAHSWSVAARDVHVEGEAGDVGDAGAQSYSSWAVLICSNSYER